MDVLTGSPLWAALEAETAAWKRLIKIAFEAAPNFPGGIYPMIASLSQWATSKKTAEQVADILGGTQEQRQAICQAWDAIMNARQEAIKSFDASTRDSA